MIDTAKTLPSGTILDADICIVGAGAAGIALALQFADTDKTVLLIESGDVAENPEIQALYEGSVVDPALHSPADRYRQRVFGGTTTIWGGRCIPFDPIDFDLRAWIDNSGWPIEYAEVAGYYPAANALCEAGDCDYDARSALGAPMRPMIEGFHSSHFNADSLERFSCPTNFAARYGHRLSASRNIRVLLNANCTEIVANNRGDHVDHIILRTLSGGHFEARARKFILAMGGLEIPRILLASNRVHPRGIGNGHDLVGRYYMCHIAGTIGDVRFSVPKEQVWHGYENAWDGVYCRRRLALTPETQRALQVGNVVMRLHHPRLVDPGHQTGILSAIYLAKPLISYEYAKRLYGPDPVGLGDYLRHVLNVVSQPIRTARFLADWAWRRTLAVRKFPSIIIASTANRYSLDVHAEQIPNPESRVSLAETRDPLGLPRIAIDWRYTAADIDTVATALRLLKQDFAAWGGGTLEYDEDEVEAAMLREGAYGGHHIGTARMGRTAEEGVVDRDCRVFGIDNLYIAGSAVFPTSSQANPTLTIVAMALRLADHLRHRFAPSTIAAGVTAQEHE